MENIKENYRLALRYLKKMHGTSTENLARIAECTVRHMQGILSENESKGFGGEIGQKIAEHFGISYGDMVRIGEAIANGKDPKDVAQVKVRISTEYTDSQHYHHEGTGDLSATNHHPKSDLSPEEQTLINLIREKDHNHKMLRRFIGEAIAIDDPQNG